ncbi:PAS domain S-box protein [Thermodesulfobacteriota bacterium]
MKKSLKYTPAILTIMAVLFTCLFILDAFIVASEKQSGEAEVYQNSEVELNLIETCLVEPLLRHSFVEVEQFLHQWGAKQERMLQIRATTPEGFLLTEFRRDDIQSQDVLTMHKEIRFEGHHLLSVEITKDLSPLNRHFDEFKTQLILRSIAITVVIGLLLWLTLRILALRPLEKEIDRRREAEEQLQQAHDTLETRVQDRTAELIHVVEELHNEIIERELIEKNLSQSEEKYRKIYNAPNDAIIIHDTATGALIDVNQAMLRMFDYNYQEALQLKIGDISAGKAPYTEAEAQKLLQNAVKYGPQLFEWRCKKKNGELFWAEVSLKYTKIMADKFVISVTRDITARKVAEERLSEERERLAVTLRSIGDGVITTDTSGRVVLLNKVAEELTGWSQQKATGQPLATVFNIINQTTRKPCENPVDLILASGKIIGLANHTVLISKDGQERIIADSGAPIRDLQSRIIGAVLVFRDTTEQVMMERELLKAKKLESVGLLAGGIAHDFNNILMAILGNLTLAIQFIEKDNKAFTLLTQVEKATQRAKRLTQQLLTFAKGGEPVKETASIQEIIIDSADFILHGSKIACNYQMDDDLWLVDIDKGQMSQVIQNLIINADHAMPDRGTITIVGNNIQQLDDKDILLPPDKKYVKITISDTGSGIAEDILEKIFDPYFTTKKEGSGLGLATTYSIISKHDGNISVASEPGQGTTFTIYLPASSGKVTSIIDDDETPTLIGGLRKVLIMDDEEMIRDLAQSIFTHLGFEVILAEDGDKAVQIYQQAMAEKVNIDLTIMDLTIPGGMGGKEAVQKFLEVNPDAKVVVSSGYSNDPILAHYQDYGFKAALIKPYDLKELTKIVNNLLK